MQRDLNLPRGEVLMNNPIPWNNYFPFYQPPNNENTDNLNWVMNYPQPFIFYPQ